MPKTAFIRAYSCIYFKSAGNVEAVSFPGNFPAFFWAIVPWRPRVPFIAKIIGVLLGDQIARGAIPLSYALPALFAINPQVGCDVVPAGLSLGGAEPQTVEIGFLAILFSRMITGPIAVVIAFAVAMVVPI